MYKKMACRLLICLIIAMGTFNCNQQSNKYNKQTKEVKLLFKYISDFDTSAIMNIVDRISRSDMRDTEENNQKIATINRLLKDSKLVDSKKYHYREYPKGSPGLVDVLIPILGSSKQSIIVTFPRKGKITYFGIEGDAVINFDDIHIDE